MYKGLVVRMLDPLTFQRGVKLSAFQRGLRELQSIPPWELRAWIDLFEEAGIPVAKKHFTEGSIHKKLMLDSEIQAGNTLTGELRQRPERYSLHGISSISSMSTQAFTVDVDEMKAAETAADNTLEKFFDGGGVEEGFGSEGN